VYFNPPAVVAFPNRETVHGTHNVQSQIEFGAQPDGGFVATRYLIIDGQRHPVESRHVSREQLLDEYERAHHEHHGMDPRGLDPREGPTRLHPGPGR
jgi:hypothetical protein